MAFKFKGTKPNIPFSNSFYLSYDLKDNVSTHTNNTIRVRDSTLLFPYVSSTTISSTGLNRHFYSILIESNFV